MKLGYVVLGNKISLGVLKKIHSQVEEMNKAGLITKLLIFTTSTTTSEQNNVIKINIKLNFPYVRTIEFRTKVFLNLLRRLNSGEIDMIYLRGITSDIIFWTFSLIYGRKIIIEINSIRKIEFSIHNKNLFGFIEEQFMRQILRNIKGFIAVTEEIDKYYLNLSPNKNIHHTVISNGIIVNSVPKKTETAFDSNELNIIFVGDYNKWNGLDRLFKGLELYRDTTQVKLYLVGESLKTDLLEMSKKLVHKTNISIYFLGKKCGKQLDELFESMHIAIGTLGLHRKKLSIACALKTREYWARGIPFVIGYTDTDIKNPNVDYVLQIPNDDSAVNFQALVDFYTHLNKESISERMRNDAKKIIDMSIKVNQLIEFIKPLA